MRERLRPIGGEFVAREREAAFRAAHLDESLRQTRLLLVLSAILNTLFLFSDWRFSNTPHFYIAVPARTAVILVSLAGLALAMRAASFARAQATLIAWEVVTAIAVGGLVTSRSDIALCVVLLLPSIFYLVPPTSFRVTLFAGGFASVCMLAGYLAPEPFSSTSVGMILVVLMLNVVLVLVVTRANRLRRLEWAAAEAERAAREELGESRRSLRRLFMAVPVPLVVTEVDSGRVVEANDAAHRYFGGSLDRFDLESVERVYVNPADRITFLRLLRETGQVDAFETRIRLADGTARHVLLAASLLTFEGTRCVITGAVDISRHKEVEAHLDRLAATDQLTGLPNRTRFLELARAEIERAARYQRPLTVMMLDLDHFKQLNDTHGHAAGDAALTTFASLCQATLRSHDVIARLGGEEFAALLPETKAMNALTLAERLRAETERLVIEGAPEGSRLTVSIGIAEVSAGESSVDAALGRADAALYEAKRGGRNRVRAHAAASQPQRAVGE